MSPFNPSLHSIEEHECYAYGNRGTSHPQNNANRSNRRKNRPRRNVASIAQGPGGFLHPQDQVPNNPCKAPTMADADSTVRLGASAAAAATAQHGDLQQQQQQQSLATQSFRLPNMDAAAAPSASAVSSDDPKLDPAGFFVHVNNTRFGDGSPAGQHTHHPRVQYIFADDDPAVLSAALADAHTRNTASTSSARANPTREHSILVDVEPVTDPKTGKHTGNWKIASASSLSGEFAVTEARMTRIEDSSSNAAAGGSSKSAKAGVDADTGGTMMLKIDGVEMTDDDGPASDSLPGSQSADRSVSGDKEDYGALIEEFDKHMTIIKKIVKAGATRAAKNTSDDDQQHGQPETKREGNDLDGEESG